MLCRDGYKTDKPSRSHMKEHANYLAMNFRGLDDQFAATWKAATRSMPISCRLYGWLLGETVGDENVILMIDELVGKYMNGNPPLLRVANHAAG